MNANNLTPLKSGSVLDGRFKVIAPLPEAAGLGAFQGEDEKEKGAVVLCPLGESESKVADALMKAQHTSLLRPLASVEGPDGQVLVSARVEGRTLLESVAGGAQVDAKLAVRTALQLVDALSTLHKEGAAHGRVHPGAVVMEPASGDGPLLTFLGQASPPYAPTGTEPSPERDARAAACLLFLMLTGKPLPDDGQPGDVELEALGVSDERLREALAREFAADAAEEGVARIRRSLTGWFVESQGNRAASQAPVSSLPPPLPSAPPASREVVSARPTAPPPSKSRLPLLAVGGVVLGLGAAYAASSLFAAPAPAPSAASAAPPPSASAGPESIDLGEVAVSGESEGDAVIDDKLSACVNNYLPKGTFASAPALSWICDETDPKKASVKLVKELVKHAPPGPPTQAMKYFSRFGRYEKPALAAIRSGCCTDPKPFDMGKPSDKCGDLAEVISTIGQQVVNGEDPSQTIDEYIAAADCEVAAGRGADLGVYARGGDRAAFEEYVKELRQK